MLKENRYAVAKVVLFGKEQIVLLRPAGKLLAMFALDYDFQVKKPAEFGGRGPRRA
jgi:non-homologous end joining protein Ku